MENSIKVYIKIDDKNLITAINSDVFINDLTGWIMIDDGCGDKYAHAQSNYLDQPLYDDRGRSNYLYKDDEIALLTEAEKENLYPPITPEPSPEETQNDFNIDIDYRVACLELGI